MIEPGEDGRAAERFRVAVKAHMRAFGTSQRRLAESLGMTEKHVSQVLRGRVTMTFLMAERIAGALGMQLDMRVHRPSKDSNAIFIDISGEQVTITHTTGRSLHVYVNGEYATVPDRVRRTMLAGDGESPQPGEDVR